MGGHKGAATQVGWFGFPIKHQNASEKPIAFVREKEKKSNVVKRAMLHFYSIQKHCHIISDNFLVNMKKTQEIKQGGA